ncbi:MULTISPECIES: glycosyltransferase family 9 protein [Cyanophyceae]|uniref:Glycosyltransferase family 9 protein n=1 Tax=Stenomitos frigidus AS-A4 TaxID=2933935 RepID=A0ABV0KE76_9CYAN|nr:glycosyltransferase family 9 protein [Phormidium sp. FACHB-592]
MNQRASSKTSMFELEHRANFKHIVVVRSLAGLGDFLCIVPALRSLRTALPYAKITLMGLPKMQPLVERFHQYVDDLLPFPGYPGLPEQALQLQAFPTFLATVQKKRFDLALQMQGSGILTNPLTVLLGAKRTAGFFLTGQYCPEPSSFLPYLHEESEIRRYIRLMEFLGLPAQGDELEFPLCEADYKAIAAIDAAHSLQVGRYICIHPGASVVDRRWSPKRFAIIADALARHGYQIVLTGSLEEVPLTQAVARFMQAPSINLAGSTNLGALAVLLKGACLLICNDTGVSHLAAALQVPSVVIFTTSDPARWAPLNRTRHRIVCAAENDTLADAIAQAEMLLQLSLVSKEATLVGLQRVEQGDTLV